MKYEHAPEPQKALVREVLGHYTKWLNQYLEDEKYTDFRYSPDHFLDKTKNQFAETYIKITEYEDNEFYFVITPHDGDDGGPATLFVYATQWDGVYRIRFILQEFDTLFSPVYSGDPEVLYKNQ